MAPSNLATRERVGSPAPQLSQAITLHRQGRLHAPVASPKTCSAGATACSGATLKGVRRAKLNKPSVAAFVDRDRPRTTIERTPVCRPDASNATWT
jgi:hypothetical protein